MDDYIEDAVNIHNKLMELEDRSRRNNIRIDGIKERNKESWEECERRVHSMLKERLDIENVEIERRIEQGEKAEVSREQLFVNSYDLKINKTF